MTPSSVSTPWWCNYQIEGRFPVGSYIQIGDEIMRVKSSSLTGTGSDELQVIRGSMGTIIQIHETNSLIKKIRVSTNRTS